MKNKYSSLLTIATAALVAGCSTFEEGKTANDAVIKNIEVAKERKEQARTVNPAVTVHAGPRVLGRPVEINKEVRPAVLDRPFTYLTHAQSLQSIVDDVSRRSGLQIVAADRLTTSASPGQPASTSGSRVGQAQVAVDHTGSLAQLLDRLAEASGSFWRFRDGRVVMFTSETRTMHVALPRTKRTVGESIRLGGDNSAAEVEVSNKAEMDPYDALQRSIQAMLSSPTPAAAGGRPGAGGAAATTGAPASGGSVIVNREFGLVTVTGTPEQLDRVERFVETVSERMSKSVHIGVRVLSWNINRGASLGLSVDSILADVSGKYRLGVSGATLPTAGGSPSVLTGRINGDNGRNQISLLLQGLEQYGVVTQVTSGQVMAINGQPSPLQIANDIGYIASSSTTIVPNVGAQTTVTPGSVRVGFTANFIPLILRDNRIQLDYSITLSQATIQRLVSSGTTASEISTPNISSQSLQQSTIVRDGDVVVLLGYEQQTVENNTTTGITSVGHATSNARRVTVILMEVSSGR